jgi:long-chain acyl-CoA synthetase
MPTEMEIRANLPKTPVGKLSKKELLAEEIAKRQPVGAARKSSRSRLNTVGLIG